MVFSSDYLVNSMKISSNIYSCVLFFFSLFINISAVNAQSTNGSFYIDEYNVLKNTLLKTLEYTNRNHVNTWYYDTSGNMTEWFSFDYINGKLSQRNTYAINGSDTLLVSVKKFDEFGNDTSRISFNEITGKIETYSFRKYNSDNEMITDHMYKYDMDGNRKLYRWDSTFYPTKKLIFYRWWYDESSLKEIPIQTYDSIYVKRDRKNRITYYKAVYNAKEKWSNNYHLILSDAVGFITYKGNTDEILRKKEITDNQRINLIHRFHSNGKIKTSIWKESNEDWTSVYQYSPEGWMMEEQRIEKKQLKWHMVAKKRLK